ncbi:MAG TPA: hypothetical protein VFE07_07915 [Marmoricola sp.]|nr:hypothetical protein [Marmoricola sp.]
MPTADDLFRRTDDPEAGAAGHEADERADARRPAPKKRAVAAVPEPEQTDAAGRRTSGRVRHDEKMTVYVTADELVDIEHARLTLRRDHGLAVDRGRLVREALAIVLADLEDNGDDSELVTRLIR